MMKTLYSEVTLKDRKQRHITLTTYRVGDKYYLSECGIKSDIDHVYHIDWDDLSKLELIKQFYKELASALLAGYCVVSTN